MDAKEIIKAYRRLRKPIGDIKSVLDAQMYAESVGETLTDVIGQNVADTTEDELAVILVAAFKEANGDINKAVQIAIRKTTRSAGLGIQPISAALDMADAAEMAAGLMSKGVTVDGARAIIQGKALRIADNVVQTNIKAHSDLDLPVHIVRKYSDVGLRNGTKYAEDCKWCLERCGEWFDYDEAYDAGCFERHPGCLCTIDYNVGKTHDVIFGGR